MDLYNVQQTSYTNDFLECVWCERWQHNSCTEIKFLPFETYPEILYFSCVDSALVTFEQTQEESSIVDKKVSYMQEDLLIV